MNKFKKLFLKAINDGIAVLKLDKAKMASLAGDSSATKVGIAILVAPFVINCIFSAILAGGFFFLYFRILLVSTAVSFGSIFLLGIIAQKIFHAKGDLMGFFRIVSHAGILLLLTVIPFLLGLFGSFNVFNLSGLISLGASIWVLVVVYNVLIHYFKLTAQNAVLSIIISVVIIVIAQSILGRVLVGPFYGFVY